MISPVYFKLLIPFFILYGENSEGKYKMSALVCKSKLSSFARPSILYLKRNNQLDTYSELFRSFIKVNIEKFFKYKNKIV